MLKLILFEIKKMWNTTFFRILMVALLVFFTAYYVFVYTNTTRIEDEMKPLKEDIQRTEQSLMEDRDALESAVEDSEVSELESNIEFHEDWLGKRQMTLDLLEEENWDALLQIEIDENEPMIGIKKHQNETHTYTHPTLFTYETYVEISKWMQEKDIEPLLPLNIHFSYMTFYDREISTNSRADAELMMDFLIESSNKYSSTSIHYLFRTFGLLFSFIGVVFFLFLFGDIVTKEGLGRNGPIYLLQTQPIQRYKILASKFLTVVLTSALILVCAVAFSIVVGSIFDGFGDWDYPVLIYGEDRTFTLMSMGVFLLKSISMFMLILLFSYTILFLFSILTKRVLVTIGLALGTLFVGMKMSEGFVTSNIAHYIPFQYFSVFDVVTNELALTLDNINLTYVNGMISLSIASFVLLVVTYVVSIIQSKMGS